MNEEEKDFFERCFGIVAGLEVENEAQAIAKEVVLDEVENLRKQNTDLKDNWNKLKEWLEEEKIRLARECSQIYEDSLGKTKLVNEDIYNELINISNKMQEIEGGSDEKI